MFFQIIQRYENAQTLRDAALGGRLGDWTQALTGVVVDVCAELGWQTAARWNRADVLPVARSEYLALDAMAFNVGQDAIDSTHLPSKQGGAGELVAGLPHWPFPVAVFELENSRDDDKVAYSLWKLLCVRARLRVLFCYRRDVEAGSALVRHLEKAVVGSLPIQERVSLTGETLLIIGSRAEESTFPYGFFKDWILDKNTGHFARS